ncbi:MAG: 5'-methylthioadenosine/adenosylhomocysteine nucleosidase [Candidatus Izemoplasmataceae bacterium]|uniref:5'-methylthioadenosine/adenosylhomocysteine nucleosidase n=1 Tax=Liberiplasma polymorphum TaxID=3374570 RepID=UPI0037764E75
MKIGLIFAMQEELDAFLSYCENVHINKINHLTFYETKTNNHHLTMILSGIGKVNAAYATTKLIEHYQVEILLNSGVAGGINVNHQAVVLSEQVTYHDVDVRAFNYVKGQVPGLNPTFKADSMLLEKAFQIAKKLHIDVHTGTIASGDQFITSLSPLEDVIALYDNLNAIEMEAGAIAHIAHLEQVPFLIIRSISDVIGDESQSHDFNTFLKNAALNAANLLNELLHDLS